VDLEDLFRSHQRELFAYFLRIVRDAHSAEELAQETMVRACGAALRFRGGSSVRTWLFGIAHRVLLEASRAGLFERFDSVDEDRPAEARGLSPGERIDLERALATLRPGDRETLVMVDMLGFEPIEVAAMQGISPDTFRVRLHRARGRLREAYGR
jgi:RNA polymerase sigma-70 factor (ECF subfamily)